jgi:hypothetical protein
MRDLPAGSGPAGSGKSAEEVGFCDAGNAAGRFARALLPARVANAAPAE